MSHSLEAHMSEECSSVAGFGALRTSSRQAENSFRFATRR